MNHCRSISAAMIHARCSKVLSLTWADVNWELSRIRVSSPKTEHHGGGASRIIPLFPELVPYLRECFERAEPGTDYVITKYQGGKTNLRTHLKRIGECLHKDRYEP